MSAEWSVEFITRSRWHIACWQLRVVEQGSMAVSSIETFRSPTNEPQGVPAFVNGFTDGQAARAKNAALTAYLRVGIDDYAKGFRAGFFARSDLAGAPGRGKPTQVVKFPSRS